MTKAFEAIEEVRALPEREQDRIADAILDYASRDEQLRLSKAQVAEVKRRLSNPNRKYLSLDEVDKRLHHFGV